MHDPFEVEPRKPLTPRQKLKMFLDHKGICCICGLKINAVSEAWDEHISPLWLAGDNSASNRAPAHEKCARAKTKREATERGKIRRTALKMYGAKKSKRPMMGSKASGWKKKLDGRVVRRDQE